MGSQCSWDGCARRPHLLRRNEVAFRRHARRLFGERDYDHASSVEPLDTPGQATVRSRSQMCEQRCQSYVLHDRMAGVAAGMRLE